MVSDEVHAARATLRLWAKTRTTRSTSRSRCQRLGLVDLDDCLVQDLLGKQLRLVVVVVHQQHVRHVSSSRERSFDPNISEDLFQASGVGQSELGHPKLADVDAPVGQVVMEEARDGHDPLLEGPQAVASVWQEALLDMSTVKTG